MADPVMVETEAAEAAAAVEAAVSLVLAIIKNSLIASENPWKDYIAFSCENSKLFLCERWFEYSLIFEDLVSHALSLF